LAQDSNPSTVSLTIAPIALSWSPDTELRSFSTTGKVSVKLSATARIAADFRWWGGVREAFAGGCEVLPDECLIAEQTISINAAAVAAIYPFAARRIFVRAGPGIAYLQEDRALGGVIARRVSWPPSVLVGVGGDLHLFDFVYLTPAIDLLWTFSHSGRLSTTGQWILQWGIGLTVG
jgi:hypothetical protein